MFPGGAPSVTGHVERSALASHMDSLSVVLGDLQQFIDRVPAAVCVCEAPSGVIRVYNQRAAALWGREPKLGDTEERFCGAFRLFRLDGTFLAHADAPIAETLRDGRTRDGEVVIERPDGSRVTAHVNIGALRDPGGRIVGVINILQDVTDRKQAEDEVARLSAIVTNAQDAIVSKTLEGIITSWNRAAERMFGHSAAEALGRSITMIIPPDRLDEDAAIVDRLRAGEVIDRFETERVTKDGRRIPISLTVSPVMDRSGHVIGASKIARDITDRRRAQENLTAHLRSLEILYRLADQVGRAKGVAEVCDASIDAIMGVGRADRASILVFDKRGVVRFTAWRGLSDGYRAAVDGHSPWAQDAADPAPILIEDVLTDPDLGALRDVVAAEGIRALGFVPLVYQGRLLGKFMVYYDARHKFSAEEMRLASTIAHHVAFALARAQAEAAIDDLLARERAARWAADAARADAERANRAKDEFLAMLAHELRNPLSVITNAVAVMDRTDDVLPERRRAGLAIRRQTEHLARLLDDLLDVARITSGRIELERERVDLRAVIELALDAQRHRMEAKTQHLALSVPREPVLVIGDSVRLQQVIGNLLNNASKYTPAGGSIRLTLDAASGEAVVSVRDNGAGIPADQLHAIFELFTQVNPTLARSEGGLGIGLTLVKRVVELHGGTVDARSEGVGRGAEFVVRLALASATSEPAVPPPAPVAAKALRILVIEDHDDGREMLAAMLRLYGHEVLEAATGEEGVETAVRCAPDVVLVDIGLPDIDGYQVGQRIRQKFGAGVRLVALTGYGQPGDRARSEHAGFDAHLVKPVDVPVLAAACLTINRSQAIHLSSQPSARAPRPGSSSDRAGSRASPSRRTRR